MSHEFDQFAQDYRSINDKALQLTGESSDFFALYKAQKLREWYPEKAQQSLKIFDFGCGDGLMTFYVQKQFPRAHMYGADPSTESIKIAQQKYPAMTFADFKSLPLPYENESFDLIYAAGAFHHILFNEHEAYMKELFRILKPQGTFVLFELNPLNPVTSYIFKRNPIDQNATMMPRRYSEQLVKPYGAVKTNYYCFYPNTLRYLRPTERFLTKIPLGALYACLVEKR